MPCDPAVPVAPRSPDTESCQYVFVPDPADKSQRIVMLDVEACVTTPSTKFAAVEQVARTLCPTENPIAGVTVNVNTLEPIPIVFVLKDSIDITAAAPVVPVTPCVP